MAKLDWNQDGLWDMAVSCLDDPAKLVTLQPEAREQMAMVKFIGTISNRDAIGLQVSDSSRRHQALHGGSGYLASNQNSILLPKRHLLILQCHTGSECRIQLNQEPLQVVVEGRAMPYGIEQ